MELSALPAPWTAAVPWARAWHRSPDARALPRAVSTPQRRSPSPACSSTPQPDAEWLAARAACAAARARLAEVDDGAADPWPHVVALHGVHVATQRVRAAQRAIAGDDVFWPID